MLGIVSVVRLAAAWIEIGMLSRRMTRAIQTVWAASFFDAASLPRKLLSFEGVAFPYTMPSAVPNVVLGCVLLLGWTTLGFTPMRDWGLMLLIEPPIFLMWRMALLHSGVFSKANFALWVGSTASAVLMVRIAVAVALLVTPAVGTAWWFYFDDVWMIIPYALPLVLYPVWLYLDLSRGAARWLVEEDEDQWFGVMAFLFFSYWVLSTQVLFGVRYSAPYPLGTALVYSWAMFFFIGSWSTSGNN
jgi:hypothetical protein